ncbi:NADP-dependent 3-hydroxy acid dehydrogenase YdfG [Antricoccus suffuscus]|uniref:NADP-dependent 3-hydroxy acid dehydrogenase YdfG n=1 Tax=Antricoccus suffuscus TaxID=1629062 RepID=A0A2T1A6V3_9ACTN|nr:SDR family oxidoreductase [Antricoccus suffuscus]PRZ44326.1 NADP-dependent 3-hydroxy acid dehydrogenase YdfG [Antricoccus suffuscus]
MTSLPTALITGASRGIGLAIARELEATHNLLLGGRDEQRLKELAATFRSAEPFTADMSDDEDVERAAKQIAGLDVLVHSAGVATRGPIDQMSRQQWRDEFEVNLFAVAQLTTLLLPQLRATNGQVVLINSGFGLMTLPDNSIYCATKWALRAFGDVLREEERPNGIRVSSIHPGKVDTDMQHDIVEYNGGEYQPELYLKPESIAKAVRLAVDATEEATVDMISVRPTRK